MARTTARPGKQPAALVERGPFALSRHPIYLGMTAAGTGVAVLLGSVAPWLLVAGFSLLVAKPSACADERALAETFADGYRQYAERTRRWL